VGGSLRCGGGASRVASGVDGLDGVYGECMFLTDAMTAKVDTWMQEAIASEPDVPDAMQLSTVDEDGRPSLRTVLLKGWGPTCSGAVALEES
jgi:pyridoxine/pyridoxamine 5'-phosphate oxidase